jgi:hypothetical protein
VFGIGLALATLAMSAGLIRTNSFNGGIAAIFSTVPVQNLLVILVGMPLVANRRRLAAGRARAQRHDPPSDRVAPGGAPRPGA